MEERYLIPWWKTNLGLGEIEAVKNAISKRYITQGPLTQKLEGKIANILNTPYVVLTTNGSSALLTVLIACGIGPKDEVIIPNITFRATAQVPLLLGANIRLVDVRSDKPLIDADKIEKVITSKTKVIIPVHLDGRAVNMEKINKLAGKNNIKVIEDAAQALGSWNKYGFLGTQSEAGIFSLAATKLITTVQGGAVVVKTKSMCERIREIRNYGITSQWREIDVQDKRGFNSKFNDLLAAIGLIQIRKIKEKMNALRNVYLFYKRELERLDYIKIIDVNISEGELPLWVEALCAERDMVISKLKQKRIQAKPFDPAISDLFQLDKSKEFKNSTIYTQYGLILPSGPGHSKEDLICVVEALKSISRYIRAKSIKEVNKLRGCWN